MFTERVQGTDILESLDMGDASIALDLGVLAIQLVGYQLLLYVILQLKYGRKK